MHLEVKTERTRIRTVTQEDSDALLSYYRRNKDHLASREPTRNDSFYTLLHWQTWINEAQERAALDLGYHFVVFDGDELIGVCNLSNVVRGVFQACNLGYSISADREGLGLAREFVGAVVDLAFGELELHRIMANYKPDNERSGKLLAALGFEKEGLARDYLFINGAWRDHVLTSKISAK